MKQSLSLKLGQHLALTPQLQQSIKLLQLSTLEMNAELEQFLVDNPLLERDDSVPAGFAMPLNNLPESRDQSASSSIAESASEVKNDPGSQITERTGEDAWSTEDTRFSDELPIRGKGDTGDADGDDGGMERFGEPATETLREHLLRQLAQLRLSVRDRGLVAYLIESIDEEGYLRESDEELLEILPTELAIELDDLAMARGYLRMFEPAGVGARDIGDCVDQQLALLGKTSKRAPPGLELARTLARDDLAALAARDQGALKRKYRCTDAQLREAVALIRSTHPKPGAAFGHDQTRYVVADVIVKKVRGTWTVRLNQEALPRIRVNRLYADAVRRARNTADASGLQGQLQEARWLIKNIQQRFDTIERVSQAIVERQRHFFDHGEVAMRPLVLREIADTLGLHESTISRVTTQKYMLTPSGLYELKYFFGSHVATDSGGAASSTAIRALIKQIVGGEDARAPLSDSTIAELLGKQGIVVARRTIAKYRESLKIDSVSQRRRV